MIAPENIVLAGFMGTGKTTVGRELAWQLRRSFVDVDEEVMRRTGLAIPDYFARHGEGAFRQQETAALAEIARSAGQKVVAAGGGAAMTPENRAFLHRIGPVICLEAPLNVLWNRVAQTDRPLARDRDAFAALLERRQAVYRGLPYHVSTRSGSPAAIAQVIAARFSASSRTVRVPLGERAYDVLVEPGCLNELGVRLAEKLRAGRCLVISQAPIWRRFGEIVEATLREAGWQPTVAVVPPGEGAKSLSQAMRLYDCMANARLERGHPVVAVGGGVVGDLGGFVAATYLRGVPFVQVPTTLLSQIDSAVGGKVAVNLAAGKNLVGSFYQPAAVLADPLTLQALPARQFSSGLAELIKYGVIMDSAFFETIEATVDAVLAREASVLVPLIARACELKAEVVAADERENGLRRILNYGHTVGHAVEKVAGYGRILHGEAVAIGMVAAARIGAAKGLCAPGLSDRLSALLSRLGLPTTTDLSPDALIAATQVDKKASAGRISWVLPVRIGQVEIRDDVAADDVANALSPY
jgi:3-dehydroquinate synthase